MPGQWIFNKKSCQIMLQGGVWIFPFKGCKNVVHVLVAHGARSTKLISFMCYDLNRLAVVLKVR